jgi:hypothetical protein
LDIEIHSVVEGDMKTTNRPRQKNCQNFSLSVLLFELKFCKNLVFSLSVNEAPDLLDSIKKIGQTGLVLGHFYHKKKLARTAKRNDDPMCNFG